MATNQTSSDLPILLNLADLQSEKRESPRGTFSVLRQDLSKSLGELKDRPPQLGGHPFSVERTTVPPGKQNFPLHAHATQWEFYLVESGRGFLVDEEGERQLTKGDCFLCPPGYAHALRNDHAEEDLVVLVVADNPQADVIYYPNSKKRLVKPGMHCFREQLDYYDGEE